MNKTELIAAAAEKSGLPKKDAERALNAVIEIVAQALAQDDKVQITGFGTVEVRTRAPRKGINPQTKEEITIPMTRTPAFKAGKNLKEAVDK